MTISKIWVQSFHGNWVIKYNSKNILRTPTLNKALEEARDLAKSESKKYQTTLEIIVEHLTGRLECEKIEYIPDGKD